jgi:hypothetical protein
VQIILSFMEDDPNLVAAKATAKATGLVTEAELNAMDLAQVHAWLRQYESGELNKKHGPR